MPWKPMFKAKKNKYDERQQLARGKAYRAAYAVMLGYFIVNGIIKYAFNIVWSDGFTDSAIGIILSLTILSSAGIMNDAYISVRDSAAKSIAISGFCSLLLLFAGILYVVRGIPFFVNGRLNSNVIPFVSGVMFLIITLLLAIKSHASVKATDETE